MKKSLSPVTSICCLLFSLNSFGQNYTDHHMHLESKALIEEMKKACSSNKMISCEGLDKDETNVETILSILDNSGFTKGVVISNSYLYGMTGMAEGNTSEKIREENLWVANQLGKSNTRLTGFFGIDPHDDGAVEEINYWGKRTEFTGLKLHLGASSFKFEKSDQIEKLINIFDAASENKFAIIIHLRTVFDFDTEIDLFVENILPHAKEIVVQIAHVGGWGSGYDTNTKIILERFANHIKRSPNTTKNLLFDLTAVIRSDLDETQGNSLAQTMREIGLEKFLIGSDYPFGWQPEQVINLIKERLPLSENEMQQLLGNRAVYD